MIRNDSARSQQRSFFADVDVQPEPEPARLVRCRANACKVGIDPKLLMCRHHWRLVTRELKIDVWQHYRAGQGIEDATPGYMLAAAKAVEYVALLEGRDPDNWFRRRYLELTGPK